MKIHCNSSFSAIKSKNSSLIFEKILNELNIESSDEVLKIFNKLKNLSPITQEEENLLLNVIRSKEFIDIYNKISIDFTFSNKSKEEVIKYSSLLTTILGLITKSRIIEKLESSDKDYIVSEIWKKHFKLFLEKWNYIFLEEVDCFNEYVICRDLRSWKYRVIDTETSRILIESRWIINFNNNNNSFWFWIFVSWENNKNYFCFDTYSICFSQESTIYEWKFFFFIIDPVSWIINRIDKKTFQLSTIDIWWNILDIWNWFLLYYVIPVLLKKLMVFLLRIEVYIYIQLIKMMIY